MIEANTKEEDFVSIFLTADGSRTITKHEIESWVIEHSKSEILRLFSRALGATPEDLKTACECMLESYED